MAFIWSKVPLYCNNESAIKIANNPVQHSKAKHIQIRHHFLRDHVMKEDIDIIHVSTEEQLANIFTKPLDEKRFCKLWCELNILESSNVLWSCTHPNTYACWWLRCANTRSNVYLQLMKTYTRIVNTLTRNLTSERHDNCAPCLGLILPIWWVTPPPNFCLECFSWRYIC